MRTALLSASLLFIACGPLIDADLPGVEICQDVQTLEFPGAPIASEQTFTRHATWTLPEDVRSQLQDQQLSGTLTRVTLQAEGVPDLSFLNSATIDATLAGQRSALSWDGALDGSGAAVIRPEAPVDVTPLLSGESAEVDTTLTGALPDHDWKLKVRACFNVRAHLTVSP